MESDVFYLATREFQLTEKFTDSVFSVLLCQLWDAGEDKVVLHSPEPRLVLSCEQSELFLAKLQRLPQSLKFPVENFHQGETSIQADIYDLASGILVPSKLLVTGHYSVLLAQNSPPLLQRSRVVNLVQLSTLFCVSSVELSTLLASTS
ncbi:hypothetical protein CRENBAI_007614 [Crenichthys baileyi]|uniref:Uncharacterized protein n=1 Tax=Crenichthys baileyi TaxID=28760 RepID=A0AAV9SIV9_9TELE